VPSPRRPDRDEPTDASPEPGDEAEDGEVWAEDEDYWDGERDGGEDIEDIEHDDPHADDRDVDIDADVELDEDRGAEDSDEDADDEDRLPGPKAAYASNWRTVLLVDGAMGAAVLLVGVVLAIAWNPVIGGFVGSLGLVYIALVAKRATEWRTLRAAAGYD
jgi:hypothetical protein